MTKEIKGALAMAVLLGGVAIGGQIVDQGAPGNQGAWKVTVVGGSGGSSGGSFSGDAGVWINGSYSQVNGAEVYGAPYGGAFPVMVAGIDDHTNPSVQAIPVSSIGNSPGSNTIPAGFINESNSTVGMATTNTFGELFVEPIGCPVLGESVFAIGATDTGFTPGISIRYITLCNSKENASGVAIKCSNQGSVALGSANPGTYLEVGDCVTWEEVTLSNINCITNGGTQNLMTTICAR